MFDLSYSQDEVVLRLSQPKPGWLSRLREKPRPRDIEGVEAGDRRVLLAIADLRALAEERPSELRIDGDEIRLSHKLAAALDSETAAALGLPPLVHLTLRTDAEGLLGSTNFRLRYTWEHDGQRQTPTRMGAIIETSEGVRRLPLWMLDAIDVADLFRAGSDIVDHWSALARFRQTLDPGVRTGDPDLSARASMTDFLSGLKVRVADRFSIAPNSTGDDFEVVPFSQRSLDIAGVDAAGGEVSEANAEIGSGDLNVFQSRVRDRGAIPAYRLGPGQFLVIDRSALPALEAISSAQRAPPAERAEFIRNPRAGITEAVEADLRRRGQVTIPRQSRGP